jgi:hypothetical protein
MHPFDSDKVLAEQGYSTLPSHRSERTYMAIRRKPRSPKAIILRRPEMKQFLIVLGLLVASAAPATALEINQSTLNVFTR